MTDTQRIDELANAAEDYRSLGLVPLPLDGKTPNVLKWQSETPNADTLRNRLIAAEKPAIGIRMNALDGPIDFEYDTPAQKEKLFELFDGNPPTTGPAFTSAVDHEGEHWWFAGDKRLEAVGKAVLMISCKDETKLVIRLGADGKGAQSAVPPSPKKAWKPGREYGVDCELEPLPASVIEKLLAFAAHSDPGSQTNNHDGKPEQFERCREAVLNLPPCIDGKAAHDALLRVVCEIVRWGVVGKPGLEILSEFNKTRCFQSDGTTPYPWDKSELKHKWADGWTMAGGEVGKRLHESQPTDTADEFSEIEPTDKQPTANESDVRPLTDAGNAELFAQQYGDDTRHVTAWDSWLTNDGRCWKIDDNREVNRRALKVVRLIRLRASKLKDKKQRKKAWMHSEACESRNRMEAMLSVARSILPLPIDYHQLNADPWLLNVNNGTVNLKTGMLREHRREDFITKIIPIDYPSSDVTPTRWLQFLNEVFAGDTELIGFVRRLLGYTIIGDVLEHIFVVAYGDGANGKSTLFNTILHILGPYGLTLGQQYLMQTKQRQNSTEFMDLYKVRLAIASETEEGARLNEPLVKQQTGGDNIRGRRLYQESWEFKPSHTLVLETNHKPRIIGTDHGIWRRVLLVPFTVQFPPEQQDPELSNKLQAESPAILHWLVQACLEWQCLGLRPPASVIAATERYRDESDLFGDFIAECCVLGPDKKARASALYERYSIRAKSRGELPQSQKRISERLEKDYSKTRDGQGRMIFQGIALKDEFGLIELEESP